jgi:hypothetical protein
MVMVKPVDPVTVVLRPPMEPLDTLAPSGPKLAVRARPVAFGSTWK